MMKTCTFKIALLLITICIVTPNATAFGAGFTSLSDCIITSDTGSYSYRPRGAKIWTGSGVLASAGHFTKDHIDNMCTGSYSNINQLRGLPAETIEEQLISVKVQVTKHANSDSDKWLLHEVERDFRNYYGTPGVTYGPRVVNGQTIFEDTVGGTVYRWVSGTKVIDIQYVNLEMSKPEPIEIVQAYLIKHPSTLPSMTLQELRSTANKTTWIKDEMDRRLWLCDKWFLQLTLKKAEEKQVYQESVKSMNIFLDYREKYYGMKAADEKNLLAGYLNTSNGTGIKAKLVEYKNWWTGNKDKAISLP